LAKVLNDSIQKCDGNQTVIRNLIDGWESESNERSKSSNDIIAGNQHVCNDNIVREEESTDNNSAQLLDLQQIEGMVPEYNGHNHQPAQVLPENKFFSISFSDILRQWAVICKIPATQMTLLMKLLRKNNNYREFQDLPKIWQTVVQITDKDMKTKYQIEEWGTSTKKKRMAYVGIENRLNQYRHLYIKEGSRGE
jgi:hypothetical protein